MASPITIVNKHPSESLTWYALPKFSVDFSQAYAKGPLKPNSKDVYSHPPNSVNIMFGFGDSDSPLVGGVCTAAVGSTVTFHVNSDGYWCKVE